MTTETKIADNTQKALWAIKEAAWQLYGEAFWKPGIAKLVNTIETEVNATTRNLGYDPMWIRKA